MNKPALLLLALMAIGTMPTLASRTETVIDDGWMIYPQCDVLKKPTKTAVTLPHSWNLKDVFDGLKYDRSAYIYERNLSRGDEMKGKRVFLKFDAVSTVADVYVNQHWIGQHKGGYTAFCMELTDVLHDGDNKIAVTVSNAYRTDVAPLSGDFNIYGGITRPVHLIVTEQDCISPLDHASDGIYIHQDNVSREQAKITVETVLSLRSGQGGLSLKVAAISPDGKEVASTTQTVGGDRVSVPLSIVKPRLWDGRVDPAQYKVRVELQRNGQAIDEKTVSTGLRYFSVDVDKGFFLNGRHVDLHGVCRHEESFGHGSLLNQEAIDQDADLIYDMGATAIRMVHYPHSRQDVEAYDQRGIVVWYEAPLAGPGGYLLPGYVSNPDLEQNVMESMEDMIMQNYNSPAICIWSLCNELSHKYDSPDNFLRRMNSRAKELDPQRLTTFAICYDQPEFQGITDLLGWNKYYGWYMGQGGVGEFFDQAIKDAGGQPVGLSEYGAAGSYLQHSYDRVATNRIHYEEYQARVHEDNWRDLAVRPQVWCKLIWQFADNPSSIRDEGDMRGMNDKGIVSYDRKTLKDSYYFYQANWSQKPMLYISARRYTKRPDETTIVKIYTNQKSVELWVNGKKIGRAKTDQIGRAVFENVKLQQGDNKIEARSGKLSDTCTWTYDPSLKQQKKAEGAKLDGAV